jgi:hypothetical protein
LVACVDALFIYLFWFNAMLYSSEDARRLLKAAIRVPFHSVRGRFTVGCHSYPIDQETFYRIRLGTASLKTLGKVTSLV